MVCPKCHHSKSHIYNSRFTKRNNQTWRRRRCRNCGFSFSTREYIEADQYLQVTSPNGPTSPFSRARLLLSLAKACEHYEEKADIAFSLLATIENQLLAQSDAGVIKVDDIIVTTLKTLKHFDTKAFLSYLATYPIIQDQRDLQKLLNN